MTWNIHGGVGLDFRYDISRIGKIVKHVSPDLAAFQEVDLRRKNASGPDVYHHLKDLVGKYCHHAWTISGASGHYGHVLISRYPMENQEVHDISIPGREPRLIIDATIRLPSSPVRIIATHLGIWVQDKIYQLNRLREIIQINKSMPILLLGDLNEWYGNQLGKRLNDLFDFKTELRTFPSLFPVLRLDRLMSTGRVSVNKVATVRKSWIASDHLPLIADISVNQ